MGKIIRVGSRKSELAIIQTKHVIMRLQKLYPNKKFEIHTMTTIGDRILNISLPKIGEKSLFTKDLEIALRNGNVDFVVHSLKDLPTVLPEGMVIGAVLEREDVRDAVIFRSEFKGYTLDTLPKGSVIGTSSLRRTAQLRRQYPNLEVCDIRGNLNTRLAKLDAKDSKFAGIILAQAGLERMGWMERISQTLEPTHLLYAVGQGALAVECRQNDTELLSMLCNLMCLNTTCRILAERSFLKTLGGGCSAPVAVCTKFNDEIDNNNTDKLPNARLHLDGAVWSLDGKLEIRGNLTCSLDLKEVKKIVETNINEDNDSENQPLKKKVKLTEYQNNTNIMTIPSIINDDANFEIISTKNIKELVNKHLNIIKKEITCKDVISNIGGGDDVLPINVNKLNPLVHSDIGTDVMGECPVVSNDTKVALEIDGKCPMKKVTEKIDWAILPTSSKCPFSALLKTSNENNNTEEKRSFLQVENISKKTIEQHIITATATKTVSTYHDKTCKEDTLLCGLYRHPCFNSDLYEKSNKLGQMLAEKLIEKGALDVMKNAQAEIHNKI